MRRPPFWITMRAATRVQWEFSRFQMRSHWLMAKLAMQYLWRHITAGSAAKRILVYDRMDLRFKAANRLIDRHYKVFHKFANAVYTKFIDAGFTRQEIPRALHWD